MLVKLKTIFAPALGTSQEAVMAPAVADSSKLGYAKLYRLMLDRVSSPSVWCVHAARHGFKACVEPCTYTRANWHTHLP